MYLPVLLFTQTCTYLLYYLDKHVYLSRKECICLLYYLDKLVLNLRTAKINMYSPTVLQ